MLSTILVMARRPVATAAKALVMMTRFSMGFPLFLLSDGISALTYSIVPRSKSVHNQQRCELEHVQKGGHQWDQ
jgi:hypothetical protein